MPQCDNWKLIIPKCTIHPTPPIKSLIIETLSIIPATAVAVKKQSNSVKNVRKENIRHSCRSSNPLSARAGRVFQPLSMKYAAQGCISTPRKQSRSSSICGIYSFRTSYYNKFGLDAQQLVGRPALSAKYCSL